MGNHAEWRKIAKKMRRKKIRRALAQSRDEKIKKEQEMREQSPTYKAWVAEQEVMEAFAAVEEERLRVEEHKKWEEEDKASVIRWKQQQIKLEQIKAERLKQEILIREEWEREQKKLKDAEEAKRKEEEDKKRKQEALMAQIDGYISGKADMPAEAVISTETHPGREKCPFFCKTGACRFRDNCSRNHIRPGLSRTLLFPNFYEHFGLNILHQDEYDTDVRLEYEESETYQHFLDFYDDVLPEFAKCGQVTQFKVCNNEESHLRGNVYVEFESKRQAMKAYCSFQGRFYGGKKLAVEFTDIPSWKDAVCGLFHKQKCPKGHNCNFLHVFRDPYNSFRFKGRRQNHQNLSQRFSFSRSPSPRSRKRRSRSRENWKWSDESDVEDLETKQQSRNKPRDRSHRTERRKRSRDRKRYKEDSKDYRKKRNKRSKSRSPRHDRKYKVQDKDETNRDCHSNHNENKSINSEKERKGTEIDRKTKRRRKKNSDSEKQNTLDNKEVNSENIICDSPVR